MQFIMSKLRAALQGKNDLLVGDVMDIQHFRQVLRDACGDTLTEHEIITIARHYQDRQGEKNDNTTLVAIAQEQLRKIGYTDFNKVEQACGQIDQNG